ncbi:glycosyltransferase family 2 protein [Paucidesulfovibrio longus]|uniref:glycosyltransferase family 2 protein n=1 Tax=Paucidesulfovibrio longus TaxID=889 RepID=UPI0003B595F4|nr:glycosyltransferase [Paucidesulfovibrio longus]
MSASPIHCDPDFGESVLQTLRPAAPTWPLGIEEDRTALAFGHGMLRMGVERAPALLPAARELLLWNWQRRPLSLDALTPLLEAGRTQPFTPPLPRFLRKLHAALARPLDSEPLRAAMDAGEQALALKHLLLRVRQPGEGIFWLAASWDWLLRLGREDLPPSLLDAADVEPDLLPLKNRLRAEWALHYLPPKQALAHAQALSPELWSPFSDYLRAELPLRMDERAEGIRLLAGVWRRLPWHPQLTLKLSNLLEPPVPASDEDYSDTCVLVYSWNKAELLEQTLRSLAASDLRRALVVALDNGSSDATAETVRRCRSLFAPGRFLDVRLPVNVGAPAARNWLLSLPEVRACRRAAFLDDDVLLPADWLVRLGRAMDESGADVAGCRIISASAPACIQSADYHLLPPGQCPSTFQEREDNILIFDNCANALDLGLFSYRRPALSVSGCCHLLSMEGVRRAGDFDIRFSPTQFDDLERDLRVGLNGMKVVYEGRLAVRHVQHSSLAKAQTLAGIGHVFGNRIKLEGKYGREEIKALGDRHRETLWTDLLARRKALLQGLPPQTCEE